MTPVCEAVPETRGGLREPPRWPPTAVGTAALPPEPPRPRRPFWRRRPRRRHTRAGRIALGVLAIAFGLAALPVVSGDGAARLIAASSLAASVDAGMHALSGRVHPWREVIGPVAWRVLREAVAWPARFGKRRGTNPVRLSTVRTGDLLDERVLTRRRPRHHVRRI